MLLFLFRLCLKIRYRFEIQGVENLPSGPLLWIGPLTSQLDPFFLQLVRKKKILFLLPERVFRVVWLARWSRSLNILYTRFYNRALSSFRLQRLRRQFEQCELVLQKGGDVAIFPEGRLSSAFPPQVDPANPLLEMFSQTAVKFSLVLFRIDGMEGSSFSGEPLLRPTWKNLWKIVWKNRLFWVPKREVRLVIKVQGKSHPEPKRIPYGVDFSPPQEGPAALAKIGELATMPVSALQPQLDLYEDLSLDSLDVTELVVFLEHKLQKPVPFEQLRTVQDVLDIAAGKEPLRGLEKISEHKKSRWDEKRLPVKILPGATIGEVFLRTCAAREAEIACADFSEMISYARLQALALGLAKKFAALPHQYIGVLLPSSTISLAVILGLILAKKIPVMLNWSLGPRHLQDVMEIADLQVIFSSEDFLQHLTIDFPAPLEEKIVLLEDMRAQLKVQDKWRSLRLARAPLEKMIKSLQLQKVKEDDPAVLLFTSGSEGQPKGVQLTHRNLLTNQRDALVACPLQASDVMLGILPPFHIFGFSLTHLFPILAGVRTMLHPQILDFKAHSQIIASRGVTLVCTTPTFLKLLFSSAAPEQLASLRLAIVGAEKAPAYLFQMAQEMKIELLEGYGLTECSPIVALNRPGKPQAGVGRPLSHVQIAIVHPETYQALPLGEPGLVLVKGASVFSGYWKKNHHPFKDDWFITGDIGYLTPDGALILQGRQSRTIKIGGELISLTLIENTLIDGLNKPSLQLAVSFRLQEMHHTQLILFSSAPLDLSLVNHLLNNRGLSNLYHIHEIVVAAPFPLLPNGKVDYRKIDDLSSRKKVQ